MSDYIHQINTLLQPQENHHTLAVDLFAGCGGLALGFEAQGFLTLGYEKDADSCATYQKNLRGTCMQVTLSPESDIQYAPVLIGGPPCQPFSVIGHQRGLQDSRDGFPIFIAAVERIKPEIWLFENVRGMLYQNKWYFEEILHALQALGYIVEYRLINAKTYGVPQNRERVIVIGHRGDFIFPSQLPKRFTAGDALADMLYTTPPESKFLTSSMDDYVARYEKASFCKRPRDLYLDEPARTLTCRNLAGATSDMHRIRLPDGRRRRLLVREAARLQSFPDYFEFCGAETSRFNQIGNAVPPLMAYHLAGAVKAYLDSPRRLSGGEIIYYALPKQLSLALKETIEMAIPDYIPSSHKSQPVRQVINEALYILVKCGLPIEGLTERRLEKMALAFLAVADVTDSSGWAKVKGYDGIQETHALKTREIIPYINRHFEENISSGSYDDIRRKDLKLPVMAGIVIRSAGNPNAARNDPTRAYALSPEYAALIRGFGTSNWEEDVDEFLSGRATLAEELEQSREIQTIPITLADGQELVFSPGKHNQLQKAVIELFLPRYGYGAELLYVGDTADKFTFINQAKLAELSFFELLHGELPDILAYSPTKNWLFLIEAVHSSGPITPLRLAELKKLTSQCTAEIVFVTAFLDRNTFRKFAPEIAWETEVWIADAPDHLIHFDGEKFLGPYKR